MANHTPGSALLNPPETRHPPALLVRTQDDTTVGTSCGQTLRLLIVVLLSVEPELMLCTLWLTSHACSGRVCVALTHHACWLQSSADVSLSARTSSDIHDLCCWPFDHRSQMRHGFRINGRADTKWSWSGVGRGAMCKVAGPCGLEETVGQDAHHADAVVCTPTDRGAMTVSLACKNCRCMPKCRTLLGFAWRMGAAATCKIRAKTLENHEDVPLCQKTHRRHEQGA